MQQPNDLNKFLDLASGQREVALVIAKDDAELQELQQSLKKNGFSKVDRTSELTKRMVEPGKMFFILTDTINKSVYDFLVQYPTGQVEIFDPSQMQSNVTTPDYRNLSVAVLVTKQNLLALENQGYGLRMNTGIAYQA